MGVPLSCHGTDAFEEGLEALFMRSISFGSNFKSSLRSFSFNGRDSEPTIFKAFGSGKLIIKGSLSFKGREIESFHMDTEISVHSPVCEKLKSQPLEKSRFSPSKERALLSPATETSSPKHQAAALKLQKVYKGFRTRRQLADCAVLVEQRWWKLLDFALLKRSSVSFFDIEKPESALSKWSRARTRAAKVGKGLSKDEKAQKLALQHWLEAIDPRHRYGHNLQFYYDSWLNCESRQPFFYWLDVGEGKEVNLEEMCPRIRLQQQCIKYLGPIEREAYEVIVEDGKFYYKNDKRLLDTSKSPKGTKWIFVLSTSKNLYVGQKKKGMFQHSSFLAGGATSAAGRLVVENGILKAVWPHSGHYRPTEENFQDFINFLKENNVDLTNVKESPTEEEEAAFLRPMCKYASENDPSAPVTDTGTNADSNGLAVKTSTNSCVSSGITRFDKSFLARRTVALNISPEIQVQDGDQQTLRTPNLKNLEQKNVIDEEMSDEEATEGRPHPYKFKKNLFVEEPEEEEQQTVAQVLILRRMQSKKGLGSLQLGKQLSCKWTTGAGPRIGFVRDYPSELQFRALEQMNLSPKGTGPHKIYGSPQTPSPSMKTMDTYLSNKEESHQQQDMPTGYR